MRLRRIQIEGFGCLVDRTFELDEQLTLVVGPNESGKTTLVRAILAVLFGQQAGAREANVPWFGGVYAATLELADGERTARIRRQFETETVELTETGGDGTRIWTGTANPFGRGTDIELYRARLKGLVGFEAEDLFRHTLCVEQLALEAEIDSDIRMRLTGPAQADAEGVRNRMQERYEAVSNDRMRKGAKPRELQSVELEIKDKTALLDATRGFFRELRELREREAAAQERFDALEAEQQIDRRLFGEIDALAEARALHDRLAREVPELAAERDRTAANLEERARLAEQIARDYTGWDALPGDYGAMLNDLSRRRQDLARSRDEVERLEREVAATRRHGGWLWMLVPPAVFAASHTIGTYLDQLMPFVIGGGAVAAVLLIVLLVGYAGRARRRRKHERELTVAGEGYENDQASLKKLDARLAPFIVGDDVGAEQTRYETYRDLRARLGGVDRALEGARDFDLVKREYQDRNAALDRVEQRLKELAVANPTLKRFLDGEDLSREREQLRNAIERRTKEIDRVRADHMRAAAERGALERRQVANECLLTGEIEELGRWRDRLERRRAALGLAHDVLGEAIVEYHAVHREKLAEKIGLLYGRLTAGRYDRVVFDETFAPSLTGLGRQAVALDRISQGARDQLYFAMRVAVAEELAGQVRLPFVLDDPFASFDDTRLAAAYEVLHELAAFHQFLVLTHNVRERQFAGNCIELA
ncbi:MAG: AAA family ATPase [Verrucomicrobia bacterium]|nr:AAA family ATPase [Verrucomicrobiota bacterium]